ncbi:MAG: hypothetical protein K8S54_07980 [Spirochaetia bacterium]|nr:hypothetical protein [Spirochaetia bacterium]
MNLVKSFAFFLAIFLGCGGGVIKTGGIGLVTVLVIDPQSAWFAAGSQERRGLQLAEWDENGALIPFQAKSAKFQSVRAKIADSRRMVPLASNGQIHLIQSLHIVRSFPLDSSFIVTAIGMQEDLVAIGGRDKQSDYPKIALFQISTGMELKSLPSPDYIRGVSIHSLVFRENLLLVSSLMSVDVWSVKDSKRVGRVTTDVGFEDIVFEADDTIIAGQINGAILKCRLGEEKCRAFIQTEQPVSALAIAGERLFSGGEGEDINVWNLKTGAPIAKLKTGQLGTETLIVSVNTGRLVAGHTWGRVTVWDSLALKAIK